jgi:hypothetical protein
MVVVRTAGALVLVRRPQVVRLNLAHADSRCSNYRLGRSAIRHQSDQT